MISGLFHPIKIPRAWTHKAEATGCRHVMYYHLLYDFAFFDCIYSGEDRIITYPNGDVCCGTSIVFKATVYSGEIQNNTEEALEHRFFDKAGLPDNINDFDKRFIIDWAKNLQQIIVD